MSDRALPGPFDYCLFGMHIRSEMSLPGLSAFPIDSEPQVLIRRVDGEEAAESCNDAEDALLVIEGVAQFRIMDGREIRVHSEPEASDRNVCLYLLGSALGMLLHQRGLLPLHANGIEIDGRAVAFMGPSGSGKSTLAAWFHDRGYRIITDDVCVVSFHEGCHPMVCPGLPRLRLWKEALEASGREPLHYDRSYAGADDWEKYDLPLPQEAVTTGETSLAAIYLLERGDRPGIDPLKGIVAAQALFANTYRGRYVAEIGNVRLHWEACLKLVQSTPIFRATRTWSLKKLDEQCAQIQNHAQQTVSLTLPR